MIYKYFDDFFYYRFGKSAGRVRRFKLHEKIDRAVYSLTKGIALYFHRKHCRHCK